MKKIVVEKIAVTRLREKIQFQLVIPDNVEKLTGISVSSDLHMITGGGLPLIMHRGIGIIRLHIADHDDCFFSELVHANRSVPYYERTGNDFQILTPWSETLKPYEPFPSQELSQGTVICGYYEDLVGDFKATPTLYNIIITLHFQVR